MIYRIGLALALFGSVAVFVPEWVDAFGFVKIGVSYLGCLFLWSASDRDRFPETGLGRDILTFGLALFLATICSIDPRLSILGVYTQPFHGVLTIVPAFLIFFAASAAEPGQKDFVFYCAAMIGIVSGLSALLQACGLQIEGLVSSTQGAGRAIGTMGGAVFLGSLCAVALPACLWIDRNGGGLLMKFPGIMAILALVLSGTRSAWIGALAGLGAFLAASGAISGQAARKIALAGLLGSLGMALAPLSKARSDQERLNTWGTAVAAGMDNPINGWGPDTFPLAMRAHKGPEMAEAMGNRTWLIQASAHNDLLQAWATTGIMGLLAYAGLWMAVLLRVWKLARLETGTRAAATFGSLIALFVCAKFNPVAPPTFYLVAALVGSLFSVEQHSKSIFPRSKLAVGFSLWLAGATIVSIQLIAEAKHSQGALAVQRGDIKGGADGIREANELCPDSIEYATRRFELIALIYPAASEEQRREFAKRAIKSSALVVQAHPHSPAAWELMTSTELFAADIFGPGLNRSALKSAKRAVELDPFFDFSARRWALAAYANRDEKEFRKANILVDRIELSKK